MATAHDYWSEAVTLVAVTDALPDEGAVGTAAYRQARQAFEGDLIAYARLHLGKFEVPKRIDFVAELPKTTTGKVRKNVVRDLIEG